LNNLLRETKRCPHTEQRRRLSRPSSQTCIREPQRHPATQGARGAQDLVFGLQKTKTVVVPDVLRLSMVDAVHDGQDLSVSAQPEKKTANAAEEEEESADNAVKERMRR
jgi:hypothetical protein